MVLDSFQDDLTKNRKDIVEIILGFLPFFSLGFSTAGLAYLSGWNIGVQVTLGLLFGFLLVTFGESVQAFSASRNPGWMDILVGISGATAGAICFPVLRVPIFKRVSRWSQGSQGWFSIPLLWAGFIAYSFLVLAVTVMLQQSTNLGNWDRDYFLLVGNEYTGDRLWSGRITQLCMTDWAVSDTQIAEGLATVDCQVAPERSPITNYRFEGSNDYVDQTGNLSDLRWNRQPVPPIPSEGVQTVKRYWLRSAEPASFLAEQLGQTGEFTLSFRIATDSLEQGGPARIVSISQTAFDRNLTIGQSETDLAIRLRTPLTGDNGKRPEFVVPEVFTDKQLHHFVLTYTGSELRVYRDSPDQRFSVPFVPETGLVWFLSGFLQHAISLESFNPLPYKVLYRLLALLPLGFCLGMIAAQSSEGSFLLLVGFSMVLAVLLESLLANGSMMSIAPGYVILSSVILVSGMLWVRHAATAWFENGVTHEALEYKG
ncbi:MAG: hypothetical protein ACFBSC_02440 [Microcoleaceae cyanobacterium]